MDLGEGALGEAGPRRWVAPGGLGAAPLRLRQVGSAAATNWANRWLTSPEQKVAEEGAPGR
jgi:hypothetical protein